MILYGGTRAARCGVVRRQRVGAPRHDRPGAGGVGEGQPTFRQVFTSRFIPGGSSEQLQWFNDLCLKTTTGEIAAKLFEARSR